MKPLIFTALVTLLVSPATQAYEPFQEDEFDTYNSSAYGNYETYRGTTSDGETVTGEVYTYGDGIKVETRTSVGEHGSYNHTRCETFTYGSIKTVRCE